MEGSTLAAVNLQVSGESVKKPRMAGLFYGSEATGGLKFLGLHEAVEAGFGEAEPQVLVLAERRVVVVNFFPVGVPGTDLGIQRHRFLERPVHHILGKRQNLGPATDQLLEGGGVLGIVLGYR